MHILSYKRKILPSGLLVAPQDVKPSSRRNCTIPADLKLGAIGIAWRLKIENVNKENEKRNMYQTTILTDSETVIIIEMVRYTRD